MATIYRADGRIETVEPANGTNFTLEELQAIVDGRIEICETVFTDEILVINEEGKLLGLPINWHATGLYKYGKIDPIVGDVLRCWDDEVQ